MNIDPRYHTDPTPMWPAGTCTRCGGRTSAPGLRCLDCRKAHIAPRPDMTWQDDALCAQVGSAPFFPKDGEHPDVAKSICAQCPVRVECAGYAIPRPDLIGVWGGMTERERRTARRKGKVA